MPVLLLGGLLAVLVVAPLKTALIYRDAEDWETRQIALDNEAIELGQSDRAVYRYLEAARRIARGLEAAHHPMHACARVPITTPECEGPDLAMEAEITAFHETTGATARAMWRRGPGRPEIPLRERRCPVCGLAWDWELFPLPVETELRDAHLHARERLLADGEYEID